MDASRECISITLSLASRTPLFSNAAGNRFGSGYSHKRKVIEVGVDGILSLDSTQLAAHSGRNLDGHSHSPYILVQLVTLVCGADQAVCSDAKFRLHH